MVSKDIYRGLLIATLAAIKYLENGRYEVARRVFEQCATRFVYDILDDDRDQVASVCYAWAVFASQPFVLLEYRLPELARYLMGKIEE